MICALRAPKWAIVVDSVGREQWRESSTGRAGLPVSRRLYRVGVGDRRSLQRHYRRAQ